MSLQQLMFKHPPWQYSSSFFYRQTEICHCFYIDKPIYGHSKFNIHLKKSSTTVRYNLEPIAERLRLLKQNFTITFFNIRQYRKQMQRIIALTAIAKT